MAIPNPNFGVDIVYIFFIVHAVPSHAQEKKNVRKPEKESNLGKIVRNGSCQREEKEERGKGQRVVVNFIE